MPEIGYLNGRFSPLEAIRLSPDDRGFLFGDGVYEVVRAYRGKPVFWIDHFIRLQRSTGAIQIPVPFDQKSFQKILFDGLHQCRFSEVKIYIQITRGVAPRDHAFPSGCEPTVFMSFREMEPLPAAYHEEGVRAITVPDIRWGRCDIKSLNLLPNVLAKEQARASGAYEAIFVRDDQVMEGATSNLFMVLGEKVCTPLINHQVLAGVTQGQVMRMARELGMDVECRPCSLQDLLTADEVFLTGTTIEVLPVIDIDGRPVGQGKRGMVTQKLHGKFVSSLFQLYRSEIGHSL